MERIELLACVVFGAAVILPGPVAAQIVEGGPVPPGWTTEKLYAGGLSVREMLDDAVVYGVTGEIGSVESVVFNLDGRLLSVIVEVGGLFDIADTHVNVAWHHVQLGPNMRMDVPVYEDTVEDFSAADEITAREAGEEVEVVDDEIVLGPRAWRATEFIGDYVRLRDADVDDIYGRVDDLIVVDGRIAAVIVGPDAQWSLGTEDGYAFPFYGNEFGWHPNTDFYDLPYEPNDVAAVRPFEYGRMNY